MQLVAVDFLPPQVLQQQMLHVSSLLAAGRITPLCTANYSLTSVVAAMRLLAQASHVGKVRSAHSHFFVSFLLRLLAGQDLLAMPFYLCSNGRVYAEWFAENPFMQETIRLSLSLHDAFGRMLSHQPQTPPTAVCLLHSCHHVICCRWSCQRPLQASIQPAQALTATAASLLWPLQVAQGDWGC